MRLLLAPLTALVLAAPLATDTLSAQPSSIVYRLGKDTSAIEQFTRSATALNGDMVQRAGPAIARYRYTIALGKDGRPTAATLNRLNQDGTAAPAPNTWRFTLTADSIVRETVFADSTQRRAFPAKGGYVNWPTYIYAPTELLAMARAKKQPVDSLPAVGSAGNLGFTGLTALANDSTRMRGGAYAMVLRHDAQQRLISVDGSGTTNKLTATRGGAIDFDAVAKAMKPTGVLSLREDARAAFGPGGMVIVDYGRPQVRERSVWGGVLVPFDSVWRMGANDATHLFTTRPLVMGDLAIAPGMYTLWVQHTRNGTFLIVNKQTGQWGTGYTAGQDLGKVAMTLSDAPGFTETMTITVKAQGATRGAIDLAWGDKVASVPFTVGTR
ncbi:MAG: DUF2911 domain-containing protein [Gemmatimonadaceae bacterium]|nr:DUF2911 domain-containing protein [Gemmatimonadaceae bacterium]